MKKTLLALMLVSSLFVISCGADSTKPQDAYKSQKTEIASGTKTTRKQVTASSGTVDVSSFAEPGEKVTEIVQVVTTSSGTTTTNTVSESAITKNTDGGIYQFTVTGTSVSSVTYKYTKSAIAPIITKTIYVSTSGITGNTSLTINDADFNDKSKLFEKQILSITDTYGNDIGYTFNSKNNTITANVVRAYSSLTIKYQYMDINLISEKPTKEGALEAGSGSSSNPQITLTANDAGKTYVCVVNPNYGTPKYFYGIVPVGGVITFSSKTGTTVQQNDSYTLWVY